MRGHFLPVEIIFLCLFLASLISGCSVQRPEAALDSSGAKGKKQFQKATAHRAPPSDKEPVRVDYLTLLSHIVSPEIYIYKEKRRLYVVQSNVVVRDYPISLGTHPAGDGQTAQGGGAPEGDFYICSKTPVERSTKALIIDYRNKRDPRPALPTGIISPLGFKELLLSAESKTAPPWDANPGGKVSIQAQNGQDNLAQSNVDLYRSDMKELFKVASIGTPVHIRP